MFFNRLISFVNVNLTLERNSCKKFAENILKKQQMKIFKNALLFGFMFLTGLTVFSQGNTNSSINGQVIDTDGSTLPETTVVAIHTPSGTKYGATTDFDGYFKISNMRVGGPYTITFSYVGFKTQEVKNVFLQLGDSQNIKMVLVEEANQLKEIVVTGTKDNVFNSKKTGAQTIIDSRKINSLPSLSRNIADFARLTPQAQLRGDDVISISGQNNRYNAIYIDGAVNNDVFGLASNGTNGGQTGVSPISLDAIEQFQVQVAPFDVKISGFAGGAISAITKSGTNNFEGSAYFLNRNEAIAGKTPPSLVAAGADREKLAEFNATTIGVRVGGAIKKDKLFYFINYEKQENETPQPFDVNGYVGNIASIGSGSVASGIEALKNNLFTRFGYDPGSYTNNIASLKSDKFIAKIDWNINDNHKLAVRHSLVKARDISPSRTSANTINFLAGAIDFKTTTNSTSLELNSRFGNKFSNNLVIGYTTVEDDRNPFGNPFPNVEIRDGSGTIFLGSEAFSTANLLEQKTLTVTDNFEINSGRHTITVGTHNEFSSAKNVFFGRNYGYYRFSNVNDFINDLKPNRFRLGYSLVGGEGDGSLGAADFDVMQLGGYIQDEFRVADNFKLTFGIRADVPVWDNYIENSDFNSRTIPLLEAAGKDLQGAKVGQRINTKAHLSPRLGFNYDVNGNKKTQIRGGFGVFTSRLPLVWPGGAYNNNGVTQGAIDINGATNPLMPDFNPNPSVGSQIQNQSGTNLGPLPGNPGAPGQFSGAIDLFAKDFKLPQVFKASLALDHKLPYGILFSGDFTYNDNMSAIKYENLNIQEPTTFLTGADNRPRYNANVRVDNTYQGIYLASNTSEGKAWNTSYTLSKTFTMDKLDVYVQGTHAYGESTVLFDATSSQNSSQWNNIETVRGANKVDGVSRSDFEQGNRILGITSVNYKWNDNFKTKIGFYYEGTEGNPFSYVYNDNGNLLRDSFSESALIYVPANQSEINFVATPGGLDAQEQWDAFNAFVEGNDYLRSRRGTYAERNGDRLKWSHVIDLKFAQEISFISGKRKHTFEISADIFNFTNLLNKNWGKRYFASFDQVQIIDFVGFLPDGTTPTFRYNPNAEKTINQIDDAGVNSSRWQAQLGVRYTFN